MWKDLKDRFSHSNCPRVYQLKKLMLSLTREDSSVSTFYTKLRGYWDELANYHPQLQCTCGANKSSLEYHQQESILQVLWGLMILLHTYGDKFFFLNPYHQWITFSHWFYKKNNKRGWLCIQAARLKLQLHSIIVLLWPLKVISTNHILKRTDLCANTVAEQGMLLRSVFNFMAFLLVIDQSKENSIKSILSSQHISSWKPITTYNFST